MSCAHVSRRGAWPVGTKISSEPELVAALGVSRSTVREAGDARDTLRC
ncbi:GntR family transcriptional regulator [Nocardia thraciensis]